MKHNKFLDVIGTILLAVGFFFAFLPHAVHVSAGFDSGTSHSSHIITGVVIVVIALGILVYNNRALKIWHNKQDIHN